MNSRSLVMEKSNKRGKIPQSDWPLIMARYEAGETLASIARTYDCSPPAISYVVSKSRARQPARDNSAMGSSGTESQLIKAIASELARASSGRQSRHGAAVGRTAGAHIAGQGTEGRAEAMSIDSDTAAAPAPPPPGNGRDHQMTRGTNGLRREGLAEPGPHPSPAPASGATGNGRPSPVGTGQRPTAPSPLLRGEPDTRHRLHLPLGNGTASHNGSDDLKFPSSARSVADDSRPAQAHTVGLPYSAPSRSEAAEFPEAGSSAVPPFPARPEQKPSPARKVPARLSIMSCAPASITISPLFLPPSTRPWCRTRRRTDRRCAKPPTGCCGPEPAPASSSNVSRRGYL